MLFVSDAQYYVTEKLCQTTESIHLFKITGKLTPEHTELKRTILWDIYRIRLQRRQYDFDWEQNKFTSISHYTI